MSQDQAPVPNLENYNRGGMMAFLFSMAFSICFIIYLAFIQGGVDLKENVRDPKAPVDSKVNSTQPGQ